MSNEYTPFEFIKSASETKVNLIADSDNPEYTEKQYNAFMVNKGFSYFPDTILHANEMNRLYEIPNNAQYVYYMDVLRKRKRFSKWNKLSKNVDLDVIQEYYQCNRNVAKQYLKILTPENLETINKNMTKGGHNGK